MTFSHLFAKDRRHQGDGPRDAPSPAAPRMARAGSCTAAAVNHALKKHLQSVNARAGSLRARFLQPEAETSARAAPAPPGAVHPEEVREVEDKQKGRTASRRAAHSWQDFNPVEVFSGFSLIFAVPPQLIPSSIAGKSSAGLAAAGQTRSCKIIAACTQFLVSSPFLCCRTSFYCTCPSGRGCNSRAMITIFKR